MAAPGVRTRNVRQIADAIIEPLWAGERTLVVVPGAGAPPIFLDEDGKPFDDPELEPIVAEIGPALRADAMILDGYLSRQPSQRAELAANFGMAIPTHGQMLGQMVLGQSAAKAARAATAKEPTPIDPDLPLSFVAVDLLAIDDDTLLDIPLLERKRILETAFEEGERLRRSVYVRPPIGGWLLGWRALRFQRAGLQGVEQPLPARRAESRLGARRHPEPLTGEAPPARRLSTRTSVGVRW